MADPRKVGHEIRSRMGAESSHLAMAEHPNQGDPIAKTMAQKDQARAGGTIAPVPPSARDLANYQRECHFNSGTPFATPPDPGGWRAKSRKKDKLAGPGVYESGRTVL